MIMFGFSIVLRTLSILCLLNISQATSESVSRGSTVSRRFLKLLQTVREPQPPLHEQQRLQNSNQNQEVQPVRGLKRPDIVKRRRAAAEVNHRVVIRTKPQNRDSLLENLKKVSYPDSALYGKHWTPDEVRDLTAPDSMTIAQIEQFLKKNGFTVVKKTSRGEYITAEGPVELWERVLKTEFYEFHYDGEPEHVFLRAEEFTMPLQLQSHVAAIFKTVQLPDRKFLKRRAEILKMSSPAPVSSDVSKQDVSTFHLRRSSRGNYNINSSSISSSSSSSDTDRNRVLENDRVLGDSLVSGYTTPALINQLYHVPSNRGSRSASHAVWESIDQAYSPADLTAFQDHFNLPTESVDHVIGGHESNRACKKDDGNDCIEANLDIQYLMAIAQHTETTYYYWDDDDFLLSWAQAVVNMNKPPLIFSISYGLDEAYLDQEYADAFDDAAMQLGLMGVTIFASAGDDGAVSPDARSSSLSCGYSPSFPASSPYVTAVGGTMGPETGSEEVVCQSDRDGIITSGGGFSTLYARPDWQDSQVQQYLNTVQSSSGSSSKTFAGYAVNGRAYPDVSALAFNYQIMVDGKVVAVSGTSASSPVMAALFSLINSARISVAGKSSVGWINPSLYQLSSSFTNDITSGNNNCAAGGTVCCAQGFTAVAGWDPVSGLGSVNFEHLLATFTALGDNINSPTFAPSPVPGAPTNSPVHTPTRAPSHTPTIAPTLSAGWMFIEEYERENCLGDVKSVSGVPTEKCLIEYDDDKKKVGSTKYICEEYGARVEYYTDNRCKELSETDFFGEGCAYFVQDSYYSDSAYSTQLRCVSAAESTGSVVIPPAPAYDGSYVMQKSYDSLNGCIDDALSEYALYLNDFCYDDEDNDFSYKFEYPTLHEYDGTGCHPHKEDSADEVNMECEETVTYSYDMDMSSLYDWLNQYSDQQQSDSSSFEAADEQVQYYYGPAGTIDLYNLWVLVDSPPPGLNTDPTAAPTLEPTQAAAAPSHVPSQPPHALTLAPTQEYVAPSPVPTHPPTSIANDPSLAPTTAVPTAGTPMPIVASQQPTLSPSTTTAGSSASPSKPPSKALLNAHVDMKVEQVLKGVVTEQFGDNAQSAFKTAVASFIVGIKKDHIHFAGIRDEDVSAEAVDSITAVDGCIVTYRIAFNTFSCKFSSPEDAFEIISFELQTAVTSGTFDMVLHSYAMQYGAKKLKESHSSTLVVKDFVTSTITDDDNSSSSGDEDSHSDSSNSEGSPSQHGDSNAMIIVLPILLVLLAVAAFSACYFYRQKLSQCCLNGRYTTLSVDSRHGASLHGAAAAAGKFTISSSEDDDSNEVEIELSNIPIGGVTNGSSSSTYNPMMSNSTSAVDDAEKDVHI